MSKILSHQKINGYQIRIRNARDRIKYHNVQEFIYDILFEFENEIISTYKKKEKNPPKSKFMEEWSKALLCDESPHDSILKLANLIDKYKMDK